MKIAIVYDSKTGRTARAARAMADILEDQGHQCQVQLVSQTNPDSVSEADLICIGTWVKGLFIIRQHPTEQTMRFIERLEDLSGKDVLLFCTYKLAVGSTLRQMAQAVNANGANVVGEFKYRGSEPNDQFMAFVSTLA